MPTAPPTLDQSLTGPQNALIGNTPNGGPSPMLNSFNSGLMPHSQSHPPMYPPQFPFAPHPTQIPFLPASSGHSNQSFQTQTQSAVGNIPAGGDIVSLTKCISKLSAELASEQLRYKDLCHKYYDGEGDLTHASFKSKSLAYCHSKCKHTAGDGPSPTPVAASSQNEDELMTLYSDVNSVDIIMGSSGLPMPNFTPLIRDPVSPEDQPDNR
ncbi:hypothetical protein BT96DRAFT_997597 [Gymnopus androsaceus JB14]|uniref:Uncharacterized protein n=1 Tax=Gymnopus androsaceus JB14 TaxID=1447944 RepID=A0A6A4HE03_9AGAR|nr:hypothetical protein BT96DRAFT_997597 [Gymnopus androsaceus JB14]